MGFCVLLILFLFVSLLSGNIKMSQTLLLCVLAQASNQLLLQLLSEFPTERSLAHWPVLQPSWPWFLSVEMVFTSQDLMARCACFCQCAVASESLQWAEPEVCIFKKKKDHQFMLAFPIQI